MSLRFTALLLMIAMTAACGQDDAVWYGGPFRVGTTPLQTLNEVSGVVSSSSNPGVLWMHNDSGDEPRIFAVTLPGRVVAEVRLQGAKHIDWEDIARGPGPVQGASYLYVADIGDNSARRNTVTLYRIREPRVDTSMRGVVVSIDADSVERCTLRYPDGARDAEALLVDPSSGEIVIVTKRESRCRVYSTSGLPTDGSIVTLTYLGDIPLQLVTGGDVSPDGSMILLKTYLHARLWNRAAGMGLGASITGAGKPLAYMPERQGEAIGFTSGGDGYYTTSECEDGGPAAAIMFYPRARSEAEARSLRDVKLPSIDVKRLSADATMYRVRYTVPEIERVSLTVHNSAMFKVMTLADDSAESGVQERTFDARKLGSGSFTVVLETPRARVATLLEIP